MATFSLPVSAFEHTTRADISHSATEEFDNLSRTDWPVAETRHICQHLQEISDARVSITCGLDRYVPPFLLVIGFVSNFLVILVMRSGSFRKLSTSFYMVVNAAVDILSLLVALPAHWLFVNFPDLFKPLRNQHWLCAILNVMGWGTSDLGVLFTVAMTTERALAIRLPLKAPRICTLRRARWTVAGLTLLETVKVSHLAVMSRVVAGHDTTSRLCDVARDDPGYAWFDANLWPWLHATMLLACYTLAVLSNIVIMRSIATSRKDMIQTMASVKRQDNSSLPRIQESPKPPVPQSTPIPSVSLSASNNANASRLSSPRTRSSSFTRGTSGSPQSSEGSPREKNAVKNTPKNVRTRADQPHSARNLQLSLMLIADSLSLVLCTLPFGVVSLLMTKYKVLPNQAGGKHLAFTITFYLLYVNRCLNFFLYCLSGARFRSALVEIFRRGEARRRPGISPCTSIPHRLAFTTGMSFIRHTAFIAGSTNKSFVGDSGGSCVGERDDVGDLSDTGSRYVTSDNCCEQQVSTYESYTDVYLDGDVRL